MTRWVNDSLRVSEEKEVVSDGAVGGSRSVDDDDDDDDYDYDYDYDYIFSVNDISLLGRCD